jgi:hypothetical protein
LELVDPAIVRRVVAVDFNPEYLAVCTDRHAASFARFEPILHDLSQGPPALEPVECVYAALVLEDVPTDQFFAYLASLMARGALVFGLLIGRAQVPEAPSATRRAVEAAAPAIRRHFSHVAADGRMVHARVCAASAHRRRHVEPRGRSRSGSTSGLARTTSIVDNITDIPSVTGRPLCSGIERESEIERRKPPNDRDMSDFRSPVDP